MSAKYSLIVIAIVALILAVNSLWVTQPKEPLCINCDQSN